MERQRWLDESAGHPDSCLGHRAVIPLLRLSSFLLILFFLFFFSLSHCLCASSSLFVVSVCRLAALHSCPWPLQGTSALKDHTPCCPFPHTSH